MNFSFKSSMGVFIAAVMIAMSAMTTFAADTAKTEIILTDVTESDLTTLKGEAKIKVSVKGMTDDVNIAQVALSFAGDMAYKSIQFLQGENNPPEGVLYSPNAALVNTDKKLTASIISRDGLSFTDETDLFILTFAGEQGSSVTLSMTNLEDTFLTAGGKDTKPADTKEVIAKASEKTNEGKTAKITLVMDKVTDFTAGVDDGYSGSAVEVRITSEDTKGYTAYTVLNNVSKAKGGHRENTTVPTFTVENTVLATDKYTVEVSGLGYVTYKKSGVTFDEPLKLTNADFIPGDVNADGKVDAADKAECQKATENAEYAEGLGNAADFNRDGKIDQYDMQIFKDIKDPTETPEQPDKPDKPSGGNSGGNGGNGGGGNSGGGNKTPPPVNINDGKVPSGNLPSDGTGSFTDLGGYDWASDAIYTLKTKGIISGVSDTEYAPQNNIKRGDFILILTRMLEIKDTFSENFVDVLPDSYYYSAIGSAKAAGIAQGNGDSFMPENTITRQDLIALAYRAFLSAGHIEAAEDLIALDAFNDKEAISDYAMEPMASMVKAGIIQGSDGGVNPLGYATRAEVAVMCARLLALIK